MYGLGICYLTCAIVIFFRDLTQIINIIIQVQVWLTPIMWNIDTMGSSMPGWLIVIFKLNPMYYIVNGYRDSMMNHAIERLYPFCAQAEGYYSGWLMSDSWARIQYDNWTFLNSGLEKAESERVGGWFDYRDFLERTGKS